MKLALVQLLVEPGAVENNLVRAETLIREAAKRGAEIVLLPEGLPYGWMDPSAQKSAQPVPTGEHCRFFAALAAELGIYLCTGLVERSGERIFNAAVLLSRKGDLLLHHRKIHEL